MPLRPILFLLLLPLVACSFSPRRVVFTGLTETPVSLRVVGPGGRPVRGAEVALDLPEIRTKMDPRLHTVEEILGGGLFETGADGAFRLDGLYPGVFQVSVYPAGAPLASGFPDPGPPLVTVPLETGARDRVVTLPGTGGTLQETRSGEG
ncbi:MAG: hypothetical protein ACE5H3_04225 [Planctomycetota bacterium]